MKHLFLITLSVVLATTCFSQETDPLIIRGNFQILAQSYSEDSLINAEVPPEDMTLNSFANIIASKGKFEAGLRYESYLPAQLGYPDNFQGSGIGYRYASYTDDQISITAGNYYEQFGNGLIFRSFQEPNLGLENAMDGIKVGVEPFKGLTIKGVYGKMRVNFDDGLINSDGVIRGIDGELNINDLDSALQSKKTKIIVGGSFVSKFQADAQSNLVLPENVGIYGGRINVIRGNWRFGTEYAEKINDPSTDNSLSLPSEYNGNVIYNKGYAMQSNISYSQKGFAVSFDTKYLDNFSYRVDRNLQGLDPMINYHPALTRQHSYMLATQFYSYASQPTGELAYMGELSYTFKKKSKLGGKYGTQVTLNFSKATGIDATPTSVAEFSETGIAYTPTFYKGNGDVYFSDFNVELKKKISKKVKTKFTYFNFVYNNDINTGAVLLDGGKVTGTIFADVIVAEVNIKTKKKQNLRIVGQALFTDEHQGDWAGLVLEYNISPHWNFSVVDLYNYGNSIEERILHYPLAGVAYTKDAHRISFEYGKRRAGLFCVGGVCRLVPASNGLSISLTSSF